MELIREKLKRLREGWYVYDNAFYFSDDLRNGRIVSEILVEKTIEETLSKCKFEYFKKIFYEIHKTNIYLLTPTASACLKDSMKS